MKRWTAALLLMVTVYGCSSQPAAGSSTAAPMTLNPVQVVQGINGVAAKEQSEYASRLTDMARAQGTPLVQGESLVFVYQGNPDDQVDVSGGVNLHLQRLGQTSVFAGTITVPDLAHAIISYSLVVNGKTTKDPMTRLEAMEEGSAMTVFRGDNAPDPAELDKKPTVPAGKVETKMLASKALGEQREVEIYLPPGWTPNKAYPVLLAADGQLYFRNGIDMPVILDNLINEGKVPPVVAVGVSSKAETRTDEYIYGKTKFEAYQDFVEDELLPWVEHDYKLSISTLIPVGLSNGGAWALYTSMLNADKVSGAILQSALTPETSLPDLAHGKRYFISAGSLDLKAVDLQGQLKNLLQQANNQVEVDRGVGGHDLSLMETQLVHGLTWIFQGLPAPKNS